jgi:outer membrane lipoprotein-sorting protein
MKTLRAFLLTASITLSACASEPQIIYVYPQDMQQQGGMQQGAMQSDYADPQTQQMPSISNPAQQVMPKAKSPTAIRGPQTAAAPTTNSAAPKTAAAKPASAAGGSTEEKLLKKAKDAFEALNGLSASIKTYENSGKEGTGVIKFLYKKPSTIKVDVVVSSDASQSGVKLAYSNPNEVKVRPTGMLSVVSVTLAMNDSRLLSGRKYQLNQIDLPATINRLTAPGNKAKLVGQSVVNGSPVYVVEINATQLIDPKITREVLSLDAKTFMPRMHEMYQGSQKVYAAEITTISLNPTFTAADFEV